MKKKLFHKKKRTKHTNLLNDFSSKSVTPSVTPITNFGVTPIRNPKCNPKRKIGVVGAFTSYALRRAFLGHSRAILMPF